MGFTKLITAIIQARMGSTRLPGKVMININQKPIIQHLYDRLKLSNSIDDIIVATGSRENNIQLVNYLDMQNIKYFCGSDEDVLNRFYEASQKNNIKKIVRITSDCPFADPKLIDNVVETHIKNNYDYTSNTNPPTFPDGLDIEIFNFDVLEEAHSNAKLDFEREHVTPYIINNKNLNKYCLRHDEDLSYIRWTLDTADDLIVVKKIINNFKSANNFSWKDILDFYNKNKSLFKANMHLKRNYNM